MPSDSDNTHALAAVDVDADGDLDLVIGNDRNGNHLLRNDGAGRFTRAPASLFPSFGDATFDLAVADLNADGRPDVLFANGLGPNRLYLNQGGGRFVDAPQNLPPNNNSASFAVALGDVDGDGDLDAAIGNSFAQNELWLNAGHGVFADATSRLLVVVNATSSVALADLDQDGDADLVFGNSGGPVLYANHLRQLSSGGPPKLGNLWSLGAAREAGFAGQPGFAIPILSFGARTPAVPIPGVGNLLIDVRVIVILPVLSLPLPAGRASLLLPVPPDQSLLNLPLAVQALVGGSQEPGAVQLTNAILGVVE
jgi:hypothetical protein